MDYDVVVIGGGPGGYVAAIKSAQLGMKVACIEFDEDSNGKQKMGGTCLNVGCIPSKSLLDSSYKFKQISASLPEHGINVSKANYDLSKMMDRKNDIVKKLKKHTRKEIIVRQKFKNNADWGDKVEKPLSEDLKDCYAMVSFHSMCAVHAVMAGVPSFCSEHSPAYPVSLGLNELDQIKDPLYTGERRDWVKSLMCAQFTETEMTKGQAWSHLNGENKW